VRQRVPDGDAAVVSQDVRRRRAESSGERSHARVLARERDGESNEIITHGIARANLLNRIRRRERRRAFVSRRARQQPEHAVVGVLRVIVRPRSNIASRRITRLHRITFTVPFPRDFHRLVRLDRLALDLRASSRRVGQPSRAPVPRDPSNRRHGIGRPRRLLRASNRANDGVGERREHGRKRLDPGRIRRAAPSRRRPDGAEIITITIVVVVVVDRERGRVDARKVHRARLSRLSRLRRRRRSSSSSGRDG